MESTLLLESSKLEDDKIKIISQGQLILDKETQFLKLQESFNSLEQDNDKLKDNIESLSIKLNDGAQLLKDMTEVKQQEKEQFEFEKKVLLSNIDKANTAFEESKVIQIYSINDTLLEINHLKIQ